MCETYLELQDSPETLTYTLVTIWTNKLEGYLTITKELMHIAPIKLYGHKPLPNGTDTLIELKVMIKHELKMSFENRSCCICWLVGRHWLKIIGSLNI